MDIKELLTEIKNHHLETYSHSIMVANLSKEFALYLKLDGKLAFYSGLLHDIGKLYIPKNILSAPRKLTDDEFEIIKKHPIYGVKLFQKVSLGEYEKYRKIIENCIISHHINTQNSYPSFNIKKSIYANIISICDCYAALTQARDYKKPISEEKALNILINSNEYDKELLDSFINYITIKKIKRGLV